MDHLILLHGGGSVCMFYMPTKAEPLLRLIGLPGFRFVKGLPSEGKQPVSVFLLLAEAQAGVQIGALESSGESEENF